MAHFYGKIKGRAKSSAGREGNKERGLLMTAASVSGAAEVQLIHTSCGKDKAVVKLIPWEYRGRVRGKEQTLYEGDIG